MKYFLDTEFIEGFHKPLFGKKRHFIDLISIGIKCEDGREYYAISNEFNPKDADQWVKDNVISKLPARVVSFYDSPRERADSLLWKSNERIAEEIKAFINAENISQGGQIILGKFLPNVPATPEFYAYYADYDWVVFCSLFGRMIDLPKGFPMYCRDLKQMLDEKVDIIHSKRPSVLVTRKNSEDKLKREPNYPKQEDEHNALDDAKWNFQLYKFLKSLK